MTLDDHARRAVHHLLAASTKAEFGPYSVHAGPTKLGDVSVWSNGVWLLSIRNRELVVWTFFRGPDRKRAIAILHAANELLGIDTSFDILDGPAGVRPIAGPLTMAAYRATLATTVEP